MHFQFGEIPSSLGALLNRSLGTLLWGRQGECSGEHRVAREMQGISAGPSSAAPVAEKETEKRHAGQRRRDGQIAGWKRRWVKPQLHPAPAEMEGCRAAPFISKGLLGALEVTREGLHEGRCAGAWRKQRCWVFARLPHVRGT